MVILRLHAGDYNYQNFVILQLLTLNFLAHGLILQWIAKVPHLERSPDLVFVEKEFLASHATFFPLPKKADVVLQPLNIGKAKDILSPRA